MFADSIGGVSTPQNSYSLSCGDKSSIEPRISRRTHKHSRIRRCSNGLPARFTVLQHPSEYGANDRDVDRRS
jgi:hypothetical protein